MARRGDGIYQRATRTLLDALLVAVGAVTAFWWFVPRSIVASPSCAPTLGFLQLVRRTATGRRQRPLRTGHL